MNVQVGDVWIKKGCCDNTVVEVCDDHMVVKWWSDKLDEWRSACRDLERFNRCGWTLFMRDGKEIEKKIEKEESYVDCPVENVGRAYIYRDPRGITYRISEATSQVGFMGFVFDEDGEEKLFNSCTMWRSIRFANLFSRGYKSRTLERCKAVRFEK